MNRPVSRLRPRNPHVKNAALAGGMTLLLSFCGLGLYSLCLDRQANFEEKLVELDDLKNERRVLLSHNKKMRDRVTYLETDDGVEEIAREKLGLVRPGELAYAVVPPPPDSFTLTDEEEGPHLDSAEHKEEDREDFGLIVRLLRGMFGTEVPPKDAPTEEKVSSGGDRNYTPGA